MFAVRCSVFLLALLGYTQADDWDKCSTASIGLPSPWPITVGDLEFYYVNCIIDLRLYESGCTNYTGAWAKVCAYYDESAPTLWFDDPSHLEVFRHGAHGPANLKETKGYCSYDYHPHVGHGAHGALGAMPQGARVPTPTVKPLKKKSV